MPLRNGHNRKSTAQAKSRHRGKTTGEQVREVADTVLARAEEGIHSAQQSTEACLMQGRKKLEGVGDDIAHYVQASPIRALAIAAGAGAALMLFLRRR